jgi:molecular chaperone DnaJ
LTVKIPAGVDDGSRIRITGSGEGGTRGGSPGDLYVYLNVARHERFRRDGNNIYTDLPIAFTLAALGGTIEVPSLDGTSPVQVVAGTQSGTTFRVRGKGMPSVRGAARGDLLATVHVVVPQKLSRRERELLEEFAEAGGDQIDDRSFFDRVKDAFTP